MTNHSCQVFKKGDRVAVYGGDPSGTVKRCIDGERGEVLEVNPDAVNSVRVKMDDHSWLAIKVHPKQCRRLKKVVRAEWWIAFPKAAHSEPTVFPSKPETKRDVSGMYFKDYSRLDGWVAATKITKVREVRE